MTNLKLSKIAILGPGLIGGSLLLACRARGLASHLSVYARDQSALEEIRQSGLACTLHTSPAEAVAGADLVILCVPTRAMKAVITEALPGLSPETVVTDVGSVKAPVVQELEPLLANHAHWIGSHPMAGRELAGFAAAKADLFEGATTILTLTEQTSGRAHHLAHAFWTALGCRVLELEPEEHDRLVAQISHLPHLVAAALTQSACPESLALIGSGFRDTTRVAAGPAEMWRDILLCNRAAVGAALDQLLNILQETRQALHQEDAVALQTLLTRANAVRQKISKP